MICRRHSRPLPPSNEVPPIGQRTQIAYILDRYQFSGASLWDGNSNTDVTGSGTVPLLSDIAVSRGTPNSGYSQQLPYIQVGNSKYTPPDTNNTNKLYNPTLSATITGNPIRKASSGVVGINNVDTITKNLTSLKGAIWDKWIGSGDDAKRHAQSSIFKKQLQDNFGSGFEIEAYVFPFSYPIFTGTDSIWLEKDVVCLEKYQFNLPYQVSSSSSLPSTGDMLSINFSTDNTDASSWWATTSVSQIESFVTCLVTGSIMAEPNSKLVPGGVVYSFSYGAQGWVVQKLPQKGEEVTAVIPVTLLTGVMLPNVNLQSAGTNAASEFAEYVNLDYNTNNVQVWDLGTAEISIKLHNSSQPAMTPYYNITSTFTPIAGVPAIANVEYTCPSYPPIVPCPNTPPPSPIPTTPPNATAGQKIVCRYNNEGIFIRGNDGQFATTLDTVINFLNYGSGDYPPFNLSRRPGIPYLNSNPWEPFLGAGQGPAYSATALNVNIRFPIIWYVPSYVDPFEIC